MKKRTVVYLLLLLAGVLLSAHAMGEGAVFNLCPGVDLNLKKGRFTVEGEPGGGLCALTDRENGAVYEFDARDDDSILASLGVPVEAFHEIIQEQWRSFKDPAMKILGKPKTFSVFMWVPFSATENKETQYHALVFSENYAIFVALGKEKMEDNGEAIVRLLLAEGEPPVEETPAPTKKPTPSPTAAPKATAKPAKTAKPTSTPKPTPTPKPTATPGKAKTVEHIPVSGDYDHVQPKWETPDRVRLILTDGGVGRFLGETDISFTYRMKNGKVITDNDLISMTVKNDAVSSVTVAGETFQFSRREPSKRFGTVSGNWVLQEIKKNGETLQNSGQTDVELTIYGNGTADWRTDDGVTLASALEMDGNVMYLSLSVKGAQKMKAIYSGSRLTLKSANMEYVFVSGE